MLEMFTLEQALIYNQVEIRDLLLGICGGAEVRAWQWANTSWVPSLAVIRQGNTIYVFVTGTENLQQLWGDVNGVYAVDYGSHQCKVHTFFFRAWQVLENRIIDRLPADWRDCSFVFVGHSLGAGVAHLGAFEWKNANPSMRVDLLTTAMPKSLTHGYVGPFPDSLNFIASRFDLVPLVPANGLVAWSIGPVGAWFASIPMNWVHYANGYYLDTDPAPGLIPRADLDATPSPRTIIGTATYHFLQEYLNAIANGWLRYVGSGRDAALVGMVTTLAGLPVNQTLVNNLDAAQFVSIPEANEKLFLSGPDSPLTPENLRLVNNIYGRVTGVEAANSISTPLAGSSLNMPCKITFFYTVNQQGFTESWYDGAHSADGITPLMLQNYLIARMKISGRQTFIQYVRISNTAPGTARQVVVYPASTWSHEARALSGQAGTGPVTGESDFGGTALLVRKQSGLLFSRFFLRGIPDSVVKSGGLYSPVGGYDDDFNNYKATVIGLTWGWLGTNAGVNPPQLITNCVQAPGSQATFTLANALFNAPDVGKNKVIRVSRQRNPRNVNGTHTVLVASLTSCITLSPLPVTNFIQGTGQMYYPNQVVKNVTDMKVEGVQTKRVGLPFGLYHGKSKKAVRA